MTANTLAASLFVLAVPALATAQEADPGAAGATVATTQAPQTQGPMIVEQVYNGPVIAPEYRITDLNGSAARMLGFYGGWLFDGTFMVGGAGYWMLNNSHSRDLSYGGIVFGFQNTDHPIGYSIRSLVGWGSSELSETVTYYQPIEGRPDPRNRPVPVPVTQQVIVHNDLFVFEPQVDALLRLNHWMRVDVGVGYRVVDAFHDDFHDANHRLHGVSGSIALQVGPTSASGR